MTIRSSSIVFALSCLSLGAVVLCQTANQPAIAGSIPYMSFQASYDNLTEANIQGLDRKVTAQFENATVDEILKWLSKENVTFVADTSSFKGARLTLNFVETKLSEVLDSIAEALNAGWERKGSVYTLRARKAVAIAPSAPLPPRIGGALRAPIAPLAQKERIAPGAIAPLAPTMPPLRVDEKSPDGNAFIWRNSGIEETGDVLDWIELRNKDAKVQGFKFDQKIKKMVPLSEAELQKHLRAVELHGKEMEKWAREFEQHFEKSFGKDFEKKFESMKFKFDHDGKEHKMTEQERQRFAAEMEKWAKDFEKHMKEMKVPMIDLKNMPKIEIKDFEGAFISPDGKHKLSESERAQLKKELESARKEMERALSEAQKARGLNHEELKNLRSEAMKAREEAMRGQSERELRALPRNKVGDVRGIEPRAVPSPRFTFGTEKIGAVMKSMTESQWNLQKERGYLLISDLREDQRKMLGLDQSTGDITISFTIDGKTLTIKSKK